MIGFLSSLRSILNPFVAPMWALLADSQSQSQSTMSILRLCVVGSVIGYVSIGLASDSFSLSMAVIVTAIFYAPVKSLLDSMVLERLTMVNRRDEFGKLRLWGPIGYGLGCFLSGTIATHYGYKLLFAFYAALNVPLLATL